jgi:hypothetical protein
VEAVEARLNVDRCVRHFDAFRRGGKSVHVRCCPLTI